MKPERVLFGIGLIACGYLFIMPLNYLGFLLGMMIAGFGMVPQASEFPEDRAEYDPKHRYESVGSQKTAVERPAAAKKASKRKKSSS
ncbi:MAG: hypothetical protein U0R44_01220 [Candidatus Micrarchaeia archaeon]